MASSSPFGAIKELETSINAKLSSVDLFELPNEERKILIALKRQLIDARLDTRDYDLSDTRAEQIDNAVSAIKRLDEVRSLILVISQYGILSSIDVAQFSSQLEMIIESLT